MSDPNSFKHNMETVRRVAIAVRRERYLRAGLTVPPDLELTENEIHDAIAAITELAQIC